MVLFLSIAVLINIPTLNSYLFVGYYFRMQMVNLPEGCYCMVTSYTLLIKTMNYNGYDDNYNNSINK